MDTERQPKEDILLRPLLTVLALSLHNPLKNDCEQVT